MTIPPVPDQRRPLADAPAAEPLTRRRFLTVGTMAVAGAGLYLAGCSDDDEPGAMTGSDATSGSSASTAGTGDPSTTGSAAGGAGDGDAGRTGTPSDTVFRASDFAALGTCLVLPELTAGPFPTVEQMERRDITEGMAGHPLRVGIQVVDEACAPVPGATVEIWHCDTDGDYSAYADGATDDDAGSGTTFFRGFQVTNAEGIVEFHTVYPGWYPGRAVHIHSAIHVDDTTVLTTQYLFDDAQNDAVMAEEPYVAHGSPDTPNARDGVTGGDAEADGLLMTVSDDADIAGSRALIVVGVDPQASSNGGSGAGAGASGGSPGGPPPGR